MSNLTCCIQQLGGDVVIDTGNNNLELCSWVDGEVPLTEACQYAGGSSDEGANPFNWGGFNSLLSTLGSIAVPFLPFLFGTAQQPVGSGLAGEPTPEEYKSQQGMVILVGFFILIALSVGAYLIIKKRR